MKIRYRGEEGLGLVFKFEGIKVYRWNYDISAWILHPCNYNATYFFYDKIDPKTSSHPAFKKLQFYDDILKE